MRPEPDHYFKMEKQIPQKIVSLPYTISPELSILLGH